MQGTALETRGEVTATAYDASGTRMVTSTAEGAVHVWDREDDLDEATEGAPGPWRQTAAWAAHDDVSCEAIAFAPAEFGQCVATAAADGSVRVWREKPLAPLGRSRRWPRKPPPPPPPPRAGRRAGELVADLREARGATTLLDFAPPEHGLRLVAAGADGVVRFYAPGNTLALLGWELTNEAEALEPGAAVSAMAWRRPTAADAARAESAGDVRAHRGSLPAALAVALVWHADALGDGAKCDARVLTYDEGSMRWRVASILFEAGEGAPPARRSPGRPTPTRRPPARRRPSRWRAARRWRCTAWRSGAEDRAEDPPRNETARLRATHRKKRVGVVDAFVDQRAAMRVSVAPRAGL